MIELTESNASAEALARAGHRDWASLWKKDIQTAALLPYLLRHINALGGDAEAALENARLSLQLTEGRDA